MKLDNTEWSLGSGSTSSFVRFCPVWVWSTICIHFILLVARILQLNPNFVLKRQMEIESFVFTVQWKTNQKCRLPLCCTASAFLLSFVRVISAERAQFIFHVCSNISWILATTIEKASYICYYRHMVYRDQQILFKAILTFNQCHQAHSACCHIATRFMLKTDFTLCLKYPPFNFNT